jgi:hypothetical protein
MTLSAAKAAHVRAMEAKVAARMRVIFFMVVFFLGFGCLLFQLFNDVLGASFATTTNVFKRLSGAEQFTLAMLLVGAVNFGLVFHSEHI